MSSINGSVPRKPRPMPDAPPARPPDRRPDGDLLTVEAAARIAGVSPHALVRWMVREGRSLRLLRADLAAFVADRTALPTRVRGPRSRRREDPRQLPLIGLPRRTEGT